MYLYFSATLKSVILGCFGTQLEREMLGPVFVTILSR